MSLSLCCAGICGGGKPVHKCKQCAPHRAKGAPTECGVYHPVLRLDEPDVLDVSFEDLVGTYQMQAAPPGVNPPVAVVSPDFRKNSTRMMALLPAAGAPPGAWDPALESGLGATLPIIQWAEANGYAVALFSASALATAPSEAFDSILMGSPAKYVVVAAAGNEGLQTLHSALAPLHPLLYSRIRTIFTGAAAMAGELPAKPPELRLHLRNAQVQWPEEGFKETEPRLVRQRLIQMGLTREDAWQKQEASKYSGLQGLKENDVPGLRRLDWTKRVERLDRDRNKDELSQLINKHQKSNNRYADDDQEEPGVD